MKGRFLRSQPWPWVTFAPVFVVWILAYIGVWLGRWFILADLFAQRFDGFSIGSNDLTQLTLGVDRDSELLASVFDEQNEAVKWMIGSVIHAAHKAGAKVGLCGEAPSNNPEFAEFLVDCGIDSISVVPDSFITVKNHVAKAESRKI